MARVLVGISTRNRPQYVRETIASVLRQSCTDIRIIVSENPSTPEVSESNSKWIASLNDPRITYQLQPIDGGEYGQGRYLLGECSEPYFCMIHDDDLMDPDYIENALKILDEHQDMAFFASSQYLIDAKGREQPQLTEQYSQSQARDRFAEGPLPDVLSVLLEFGLFSISGAVFRRCCIVDYGLVDSDLGGIYPFEFNVFLRIAERGLPCWYSPRRLIAYRWHDTSMRNLDGSILTRYMVEQLVELLDRRKFVGRQEKLRRKLLSYNLRNLGYILMVDGQRKRALEKLYRAVRLNPVGASLWVYLLAALLVPKSVENQWRKKVNLDPPPQSWTDAIPEEEKI